MLSRSVTIVIVLVLLIVFYFNYKSFSKAPERLKTKSGGSGRGKGAARKGKKAVRSSAASGGGGSSSGGSSAAERDSDDDESGADGLSAKELYGSVHRAMASGMSADDFKDTAPDYAVNMVYIELKQLYADGAVPNVADYERVLKNEGVI